MPSRARAGNLTAALVVVSVLELLVNRLANRLFLPRSTISGAAGISSVGRAISDSGPFLFHLAGILALVILVMAFVGLLRRGELFPRGVRFTVALIAGVFLLLASLTLLFDRPPRFALHVETSFGFLSLLIAASLLGTPVLRRVKLGFFLLIVPGVIHVGAMICERTGWLRGTAGMTLLLARLSEAALLAATIAAPALFSPRPWRERRWRVPLAVAVAAAVGFTVTLATRFDLLQAAVLYGLRMDLPRLGSPLGMAYVLALAGWVFAITQLLGDKGGMRLAGYGLLLLGLAGYQVGSPVEIAIALVGLLSVAVGELRAVAYGDVTRPRPSAVEWREYVGRVATAASDAPAPDGSPPEAVVVEEDEVEMTRIRGHRRGRPLGIRFLRRRGQVVEYEVVVGEPGRAPASATIERHHSWLAKSPEQKLALPRTRTGDSAFDQKFSVHGPAPLGNEALRRQLMRQGGGVVSLWTGAAARYRAITDGSGAMDAPLRGMVQGSEPVDAVLADLDTLLDLVEASSI